MISTWKQIGLKHLLILLIMNLRAIVIFVKHKQDKNNNSVTFV